MGGTFTFHQHAIFWVVSHDCTHMFVFHHRCKSSLVFLMMSQYKDGTKTIIYIAAYIVNHLITLIMMLLVLLCSSIIFKT